MNIPIYTNTALDELHTGLKGTKGHTLWLDKKHERVLLTNPDYIIWQFIIRHVDAGKGTSLPSGQDWKVLTWMFFSNLAAAHSDLNLLRLRVFASSLLQCSHHSLHFCFMSISLCSTDWIISIKDGCNPFRLSSFRSVVLLRSLLGPLMARIHYYCCFRFSCYDKWQCL